MTAAELLAARQALGLSISEMARRLRMPRGTYLKYERGERRGGNVPDVVEVAIRAIQPGK